MTTATTPLPSPAGTPSRAMVAVFARRLVSCVSSMVKTAGASVLGVAGLASIAVGAGMIYLPAGLIVGGALAVWVASLLPDGGSQ